MTDLSELMTGETRVGETEHFLITVPPNTPEARAAGVAIAATCEADLATLSYWFAVRWDYFPYGIWVSVHEDADHEGGPWAENIWFGDSGSPHIIIHRATLANSAGSQAIRDELARMFFAAELAEVLMHYSPNGWNPHNSAGEALSRVAGAELHPVGYYRPAGSKNNGPYCWAWLQLADRGRKFQDADAAGPRYDFITVSENNDNNPISFGVGILFLYYLHTQLNVSWRRIATSWGAHLCETFEQVTGRPKHLAYQEFADVLTPHIAPGVDGELLPRTENVFPLVAKPPVVLTSSEEVPTKQRDGQQHLVNLKAGPLCDATAYSYQIIQLRVPVTVIGHTYGAYAPRFQWSVNGVALPVRGTVTQVTIPVRVINTVPGHGESPKDGVPVNFTYLINALGSASRLHIVNLASPGNIEGLEITAVVIEAAASVVPGQLHASTTARPTWRMYELETQWYMDLSRCNLELGVHAVVVRDALVRKIQLLKNIPDPAPEQINDLVRAAQQYAEVAARLPAASQTSIPRLADTLDPSASTLASDMDSGVIEGVGQRFRIVPATADHTPT